jgi:hypothetical protein
MRVNPMTDPKVIEAMETLLKKPFHEIAPNYLPSGAIDQFIDQVAQGEIPVKFPPEAKDNLMMGYTMGRQVLTNGLGMWGIVDLTWTQELVITITQHHQERLSTNDLPTILEVMGGKGYLAKALTHHGLTVTCTDDRSWNYDEKGIKDVYPVETLDAVAAVEKYGSTHDVLLMSWVPYDSDIGARVAKAWGKVKPIIVIGEPLGGCTGDDEFNENMEYDPNLEVDMPSWAAIHDYCQIGYWTGGVTVVSGNGISMYQQPPLASREANTPNEL